MTKVGQSSYLNCFDYGTVSYTVRCLDQELISYVGFATHLVAAVVVHVGSDDL